MKNLIQKYFMAIVAVMMVVGFSAFKVAERISDDPEGYIPWYFTGDEPAETTQEEHYQEEDALLCLGGDNVVCEIIAPANGDEPNLDAHIDPDDTESPTIRELIEEAMNANPKTTNDAVKSLRF